MLIKEISPRAGASAHGHVKTHPEIDAAIIAHYPLFVRVVICACAVLLISGLPIIALAALQMWLYELFGLPAFFGSMNLDLIIIYGVVRYVS